MGKAECCGLPIVQRACSSACVCAIVWEYCKIKKIKWMLEEKQLQVEEESLWESTLHSTRDCATWKWSKATNLLIAGRIHFHCSPVPCYPESVAAQPRAVCVPQAPPRIAGEVPALPRGAVQHGFPSPLNHAQPSREAMLGCCEKGIWDTCLVARISAARGGHPWPAGTPWGIEGWKLKEPRVCAERLCKLQLCSKGGKFAADCQHPAVGLFLTR